MTTNSYLNINPGLAFDMITCSPKEHYEERINEVDVINSEISYKEFFLRFMRQNRPCIFSSHFTQLWKSRKLWTDEAGRPNFDYLEKEFGKAVTPVANCDLKFYNSHCKQNMLVKDYISYWRKKCNDTTNMPCLYLKDWHFNRDFPTYEAYLTPVYFMSDWLNEYWDFINEIDDYRFVYMGPKGSWTPFHADVFGSYSWSANICGMKKWLLVPPGKEKQFFDSKGNLLFDIIPNILNQAKDVIEIIQKAGEIIFIPSGWYHQVWNLEDTISINHNWFNGCNIDHIYKQLYSAIEQVQKEISDCKDMEDWDMQCQVILKAHHGMDFKDFFHLLECIGNRALSEISRLNLPSENTYHNVFDLLKVQQTLQYILTEDLLNFNLECDNNARLFYKRLKDVLDIFNIN